MNHCFLQLGKNNVSVIEKVCTENRKPRDSHHNRKRPFETIVECIFALVMNLGWLRVFQRTNKISLHCTINHCSAFRTTATVEKTNTHTLRRVEEKHFK